MATRRSKEAGFAPVMPVRIPSRMHMSGRLARRAMKGLGVGKKVIFKVRGKVRSLSSSEYDDSLDMDLDSCETCEDDATSLTRAMKRRNRHMASGRFTR